MTRLEGIQVVMAVAEGVNQVTPGMGLPGLVRGQDTPAEGPSEGLAQEPTLGRDHDRWNAPMAWDHDGP